MHLKGWTKPLPNWLEEAVRLGILKVYEEKGVEYLAGSLINPHTGTRVTLAT